MTDPGAGTPPGRSQSQSDERPGRPACDGQPEAPQAATGPVQPAGEQGGPKGPEPTRFGDWEKDGRCFDF
jgi:hypothetical protein